MKKFICILLVWGSLFADRDMEEVFTIIYREGIWGAEGFSGGGSTVENTIVYMAFLQHFLRSNNIKTVVDVGCGDWQFSQYIHWDGIEYYGYDVVQYILDRNQEKFSADNIHFIHGDATTTDLPPADLLICKDVLQHLPEEDIFNFLRQLHKYKHILITNDVNVHTLTCENQNILRGGGRKLDLTKPPYNLQGVKALTYERDGFMKQVLYIRH